MKIYSTKIDGVFEIENKFFEDERGQFVKTFNADFFQSEGLDSSFKESFFSISKKDVIRGMHFQKPPYDHSKLVYVIAGEILDVAVDIRSDSATFGQYYATKLSAENAKSLYMEKGFAHGFLTLSSLATVVYMTTSVYNPDSDSGIRWDSFGLNWPIKNPTISQRDEGFERLI